MLFKKASFLFWVQFQWLRFVLNGILTLSVPISMVNSFSLVAKEKISGSVKKICVTVYRNKKKYKFICKLMTAKSVLFMFAQQQIKQNHNPCCALGKNINIIAIKLLAFDYILRFSCSSCPIYKNDQSSTRKRKYFFIWSVFLSQSFKFSLPPGDNEFHNLIIILRFVHVLWGFQVLHCLYILFTI